MTAMGGYDYDPINNCNEDNNGEGKVHPYRRNKATGDNDVDMALQISEPRNALSSPMRKAVLFHSTFFEVSP